MSEVAPSSAWERVKRAKRREIDAHRKALAVHENTAAMLEELRLEERAAVVRARVNKTRAMLDLAFKEAEALSIDIN
jgi:hypothetical protein